MLEGVYAESPSRYSPSEKYSVCFKNGGEFLHTLLSCVDAMLFQKYQAIPNKWNVCVFHDRI